MKRPVLTVSASIVGLGIGWTAGQLGMVLGSAELLAVLVLGAVLGLLISG